MKAYVAYRLPNAEQAQHFIGSAREIQSLSEMKGEGVVLHSFDGKQIYYIDDLTGSDIDENPLHLTTPVFESSSKEEYMAAFNQIKGQIDSGKLEKVILSRTISTEVAQSPASIFKKLNEEYENTFNYMIKFENGLCWMGATPELLVEKDGLNVKSMALAGTKSAGLDSKWSYKEKEEHQFVTDHIKTVYEGIGCQDFDAYGPLTVRAGYVDHLSTEISANLNSEGDFIPLLTDLHPTPAVCGKPSNAAASLINEVESQKREFYTGFVGIRKKDRECYFVNLRCMQLNKGNALLYVGGGITSGSSSEAEWEETELKAQTLLSVLD